MNKLEINGNAARAIIFETLSSRAVACWTRQDNHAQWKLNRVTLEAKGADEMGAPRWSHSGVINDHKLPAEEHWLWAAFQDVADRFIAENL